MFVASIVFVHLTVPAHTAASLSDCSSLQIWLTKFYVYTLDESVLSQICLAAIIIMRIHVPFSLYSISESSNFMLKLPMQFLYIIFHLSLRYMFANIYVGVLFHFRVELSSSFLVPSFPSRIPSYLFECLMQCCSHQLCNCTPVSCLLAACEIVKKLEYLILYSKCLQFCFSCCVSIFCCHSIWNTVSLWAPMLMSFLWTLPYLLPLFQLYMSLCRIVSVNAHNYYDAFPSFAYYSISYTSSCVPPLLLPYTLAPQVLSHMSILLLEASYSGVLLITTAMNTLHWRSKLRSMSNYISSCSQVSLMLWPYG